MTKLSEFVDKQIAFRIKYPLPNLSALLEDIGPKPPVEKPRPDEKMVVPAKTRELMVINPDTSQGIDWVQRADEKKVVPSATRELMVVHPNSLFQPGAPKF